MKYRHQKRKRFKIFVSFNDDILFFMLTILLTNWKSRLMLEIVNLSLLSALEEFFCYVFFLFYKYYTEAMKTL
jgi:Ca2+/Na+ antiporter